MNEYLVRRRVGGAYDAYMRRGGFWRGRRDAFDRAYRVQVRYADQWREEYRQRYLATHAAQPRMSEGGV